jgi:hypothetical protein
MPAILERLVQQLQAKGKSKSAAYAIATSTLQKSGSLKKGSQEMTAKGKKRSAMGAAGRAKDRAAKARGGKPSDYTYNQLTNAARKKKGR